MGTGLEESHLGSSPASATDFLCNSLYLSAECGGYFNLTGAVKLQSQSIEKHLEILKWKALQKHCYYCGVEFGKMPTFCRMESCLKNFGSPL